MAASKIQLKALKLAETLAPMGADVVALGFPLGQDALKISKGNIAGNEESLYISLERSTSMCPPYTGSRFLEDEKEYLIVIDITGGHATLLFPFTLRYTPCQIPYIRG